MNEAPNESVNEVATAFIMAHDEFQIKVGHSFPYVVIQPPFLQHHNLLLTHIWPNNLFAINH